MQGYEEDLAEEAGYDDYYSGDDDELEQEYEDEEEEEHPKEELEYLELRQKLKESIRKNMGKGNANAQSSQERRRKLPYNDFGSFFGPSRPVISSRVIQESKSVLENEIRTARMLNSSEIKKRPLPTSGSGTKIVSHEKQLKVVSEVRRKVETLKDARDYSFLLSEDAKLPVSKNESLSRCGSFPNSEARAAQLSARTKQSSGISRTAHCLPRDEKRPVSVNGHLRPSSCSSQMNHSRPASSGSQMQSLPVSGRPTSSGSHMPNSRLVSSGSQMPNSRLVSSGSQMQQRAVSSGNQRPGSLTNRQGPNRPPCSTINGQSANWNGQHNSRSDSQRPVPAKVSVDHRKQMSNSNVVGPGRSAPLARPLPSNSSLERKPSIMTGKSSLQKAQRPASSRPMPSDPRQLVVEQIKVSRDPATSRLIPKQSVPTSKHQMMSKPAPKRLPPRDIDDDRRPLKKKPARMSEDVTAFKMLREMLKTDRYAGRDDDDRNMEANYDDIMKEERRSARIARKEDEEQARLIEEEERQERLRKARKLNR